MTYGDGSTYVKTHNYHIEGRNWENHLFISYLRVSQGLSRLTKPMSTQGLSDAVGYLARGITPVVNVSTSGCQYLLEVCWMWLVLRSSMDFNDFPALARGWPCCPDANQTKGTARWIQWGLLAPTWKYSPQATDIKIGSNLIPCQAWPDSYSHTLQFLWFTVLTFLNCGFLTFFKTVLCGLRHAMSICRCVDMSMWFDVVTATDCSESQAPGRHSFHCNLLTVLRCGKEQRDLNSRVHHSSSRIQELSPDIHVPCYGHTD